MVGAVRGQNWFDGEQISGARDVERLNRNRNSGRHRKRQKREIEITLRTSHRALTGLERLALVPASIVTMHRALAAGSSVRALADDFIG